MHRTKKLALIGIICSGMVIALVLAVAVAMHLLADRDLVKSYIVKKTAQTTGGQLNYDHVKIDWLPLPHLAVQNVKLVLPEAVTLRADELSVYPRLLAIIMGRPSIRRLRLIAPDIVLAMPPSTDHVPRQKAAEDPGAGLFPALSAVMKKQIGSVFGVLTAIDPETQVQIDNGRVTLDLKNQPDIQLHSINVSAERTDHALSLDLSVGSDLVEKLTFTATADVTRSQAKGGITLAGINPQAILSRFSPLHGIRLENTRADAELDFDVNGAEHVNSRLRLKVPGLGIMRGNRLLNVGTVTLSGEVLYEKNQLSLRLDKLTARKPALALSLDAALKPDQQSSRLNLELKAGIEALDLAAVSDAALHFYGDQESIRMAVDMIKAGLLTGLSGSAGLTHDQNAWHLNQIKASGRLSQGLISIPGINASIANVNGEIAYENDRVDFSGLSGVFEGAAFDQSDVAIDWTNQTTLSIRSSTVDVEAAPFFNWLTGFEALAGIKQHVSVISGRAAISRLNISGLLSEPAKWDMDILASPEDLVLNTSQAPFDIKVSGGEINYRPGGDRSSNVGIEFLDASFIAAHQTAETVDARTVALQVDGSVGADTLAWLAPLASIPEQLLINPPVSLSGIHLTWTQGGRFSLTGGLKTADGVALSVDMAQSPEKLEIHEIQLSDSSSRATLSGSKKDALIDLTFAGNIEKPMVDRLLKGNTILTGKIEGDFKARVDTDTPLKSTFVGKLNGSGIQLPDLAAIPITVGRFALTGHGNRLTIQPSEVTLDDTRLEMEGTIVPHEQALLFDINLGSDHFDMALIKALQSDEKKPPSANEEKPPPKVVPRGTIHFKTRSLTYGDFTWSPVQADIRIEPDSTFVTINQANLCGISTTGDLDITPQGISMNISPMANNASLQKTSDCLWDKDVRVDARYDLVGNIVLPPTQDDPLKALSGRATYSSQNGRIYRSSTLLKIFSVLNITELFTGGKSDINKQGYGYSKAWIKARFDNGKLKLEEVLLDGNALKITGQGSIDMKAATADIIVLAAPLKTVDRLVNTIPLFRYLTGGSLITVPLRLHGNIKDLSVVPLPPSAVGKGLLDFMERTLKAPFKLVEGGSARKKNGESTEPATQK